MPTWRFTAARRALDDAGVEANDLDAIIMGTVSADYLNAELGLCAGRFARRAQRILLRCRRGVFGIYQCHLGGGFFYSFGQESARLWLSVPTRSAAWLNWQDRTTCILFGDAAGAVVLGASENGAGILSTKLRTDGSYVKQLYVPAGGSLQPATPATVQP